MIPLLQEWADARSDAAGEERQPIELERWTFHDIRRTGTTAMQSLGVPVDTVEKAVNHRSGQASTGVAKVYQLWKYEPEKREAFDKWGAFLSMIVAGVDGNSARVRVLKGEAGAPEPDPSNVVRLERRA